MPHGLRFFVAAAEFALQFITLTASRFQIELHIFHVELQLIHRFLGDAKQAIVQARIMIEPFTHRQHLLTKVKGQLLDLFSQVEQFGRNLIFAPFLGVWLRH